MFSSTDTIPSAPTPTFVPAPPAPGPTLGLHPDPEAHALYTAFHAVLATLPPSDPMHDMIVDALQRLVCAAPHAAQPPTLVAAGGETARSAVDCGVKAPHNAPAWKTQQAHPLIPEAPLATFLLQLKGLICAFDGAGVAGVDSRADPVLTSTAHVLDALEPQLDDTRYKEVLGLVPRLLREASHGALLAVCSTLLRGPGGTSQTPGDTIDLAASWATRGLEQGSALFLLPLSRTPPEFREALQSHTPVVNGQRDDLTTESLIAYRGRRGKVLQRERIVMGCTQLSNDPGSPCQRCVQVLQDALSNGLEGEVLVVDNAWLLASALVGSYVSDVAMASFFLKGALRGGSEVEINMRHSSAEGGGVGLTVTVKEQFRVSEARIFAVVGAAQGALDGCSAIHAFNSAALIQYGLLGRTACAGMDD